MNKITYDYEPTFPKSEGNEVKFNEIKESINSYSSTKSYVEYNIDAHMDTDTMDLEAQGFDKSRPIFCTGSYNADTIDLETVVIIDMRGDLSEGRFDATEFIGAGIVTTGRRSFNFVFDFSSFSDVEFRAVEPLWGLTANATVRTGVKLFQN
jgi:hypothetical protein